MRYLLIALCMLFCSATPAIAQVSVGIGLPSVNIGINIPLFPDLVPVPGYPVYYAPQLNSNYFFYDGMYWVYQGDNWYASSWYNGPWDFVDPEEVPLFVLRIPVSYYRDPPRYFRGWRPDAPPRWGDHWGNGWEQHRSGWDRWDHNSNPRPAPLPVYQRQYSGDHYPRAEQQQNLHSQNYRYQPRDPVVRQHNQEPAVQRSPVTARPEPQPLPQERSSRSPESQRSSSPAPRQQNVPAALPSAPPPQRGGEEVQRTTPTQAMPQQRGPAVQQEQRPQPQPQQGVAPREQSTPRSSQESSPQGRGGSQEPRQGQGQEKERDKGEDHGQERNR